MSDGVVLGFQIWIQSNGVFKNTSTSPAGNGAPFTVSGPGVALQAWDGGIYPNNWLSGISDPISDPQNAIDGGKHAARIIADPLSSLGSGCLIPLADRLHALGVPNNICVSPNALSQTAVAADWIDTGGFATVPSYQTLAGCALRRLHYMSRYFGNFQLGAIILASGETEAFDASPTSANALAASYDTLMNNILAYLNKAKIPCAKQTKFLIPLLSTGYLTFQGAPQTTIVRTQQLLIATQRSDVQTFDDGYPGQYLHLDKTAQATRGVVGANTYFAAP